MHLPSLLGERLQHAVNKANLSPPDDFSADVSPTQDSRFGDYQSNVALVLAKASKTNPRALATEIARHFDSSELCNPPDVAGPGFLNFQILPQTWAKVLDAQRRSSSLGVPPADKRKRIALDFSAPNIAKPMHVGHIRSTIIGDALARIARFVGHDVITDNHLGDWGTQFGMIIYGWKNFLDRDALEHDPITELVRIYKHVNALGDEDPQVREQCKAELIALQAGNPENLEIWRKCVSLSKQGLDKIYRRLDVHFDHWLGESAYNEQLAPLVEDLLANNIASISDGAVCIFFPEDSSMADTPCLIRKADGGFLYATTDLATINFRITEWQTDEIWYVVGAPQQLHFQQIFAAARKMGCTSRLLHIPHGSILGADRKLMKTRSGENVQLSDVLEEAVQRAHSLVAEKNPDLGREEQMEIAEVVGVGAVKFAELSQHRMTDYVFSWDKMLALTGDTAPYLMYSYVRIQSILRKFEEESGTSPDESAAFLIAEESETNLARLLARFSEVVPAVLDDHRPHILANYLLDLARAYHSFFEQCPVLRAASDNIRNARLALCQLTAEVLNNGLSLLGIKVPSRM